LLSSFVFPFSDYVYFSKFLMLAALEKDPIKRFKYVIAGAVRQILGFYLIYFMLKGGWIS